jgi:hypothetical protein
MVMEQLFKLQNLHEMSVDGNFEDYTIPCRIKGTHRIGQYFGSVLIYNKPWGIVLLSGQIKPDLIEIYNLEVLRLNWVDLKVVSTSEDHDNG